MSSHYAKPENALQKAADLVKVKKEGEALVCLHKILVLISKRHRTWQQTHERIMEKYVELAVQLRRNVKDALVQYRMICHPIARRGSSAPKQTINVASLEKIMRQYLELSQRKADEAQKQADHGRADSEIVLAASDDLEETPESIMLQAVSGEDSRDRKDREILTPWVKYLWETYRTILDVLRNNKQLQEFYQETARKAFLFCKRFQRRTEFRRLCDIMRTHLTAIQKHQHQTNAVDLTSPETQALYLATRFEQLKIASDLELWQEAYRTIEDIHDHMRLSSVPPSPGLMKFYYEKLARIFWASENELFHAYSLNEYRNLLLEQEQTIDAVTKASLGSAVLLATLVVNPQDPEEEDDDFFSAEDEGNLRLAALLKFKKETPTRARLMEGLIVSGILDVALEPVKAIYNLMETSFGPLSLKRKLLPLLAELEKHELLVQYIEPLKKLAVLRLLQQLSSVYKTIRFEKFRRLAPDLSFHAIELIAMKAVRDNHLHLRLDHRSKVIIFADEDFTSHKVREQLSILADRLQKVNDLIEVERPNQQERQSVFREVKNGMELEHDEVFKRQHEIEQRKIAHEKSLQEKELLDQQQKAAEAAQRRKEERQRLDQESARREQERLKREKEAQDLKAKQTLVAEMKRKYISESSGKRKGKGFKEMQSVVENFENVDKSRILAAQNKVVEQAAKEAERRRKEQARRLSYLTRALRDVESKKLVEQHEKQRILDRAQYEKEFEQFVVQKKALHQKVLAEKARLSRMAAQKKLFHDKLMARRNEIYEKELAIYEQKNKEKEDERRRAEERRQAEEEAKRQEEERLQKIEQERREAEERKLREEEEERARIRAEKEEQQRQLDEIARLQREREAAVERELASKRSAKPAVGRWGRRGDGDERSARRETSEPESGGGKWRPSGGRYGRGSDRSYDEDRGGRGGDRFRRGDEDRGGRDRGFDRRDEDRGGRDRGFDRRDEDRGGRSGGRFSRGGDRDMGSRGGDRDFGSRGGDRDYGSRGGDRDYGSRGSDRDYGSRGGDRDYGSRGGDRDFGRRGGDGRGGDIWRRPGAREERRGNESSSGGAWRSRRAQEETRTAQHQPAAAPTPVDDNGADDGFTTVRRSKNSRRPVGRR